MDFWRWNKYEKKLEARKAFISCSIAFWQFARENQISNQGFIYRVGNGKHKLINWSSNKATTRGREEEMNQNLIKPSLRKYSTHFLVCGKDKHIENVLWRFENMLETDASGSTLEERRTIGRQLVKSLWQVTEVILMEINIFTL